MSLTLLGCGKGTDSSAAFVLPVTSGLVGLYLGDLGTFKDTGKATPASADGDVVGAWADQSGLGHDLPMIGGHGATLKTALLNGRNVVRCDGVASILQATFTLNNPLSVYMVAQQRSNTVGAGVFDGKTSSSTLVYQSTSPQVILYSGGNAAILTTWALNTFRIVGFRWETVNGVIRFGGADGTPVTLPSVANAGGVTLGNRGSGANPCAIDYAMVAVYNRTLTGPEQVSNEAAITAWWGVS